MRPVGFEPAAFAFSVDYADFALFKKWLNYGLFKVRILPP